MTQEKKTKMWQIFGGSLVAIVTAILIYAFNSGVQARTMQFNTERIKQNEHHYQQGLSELKTDIGDVKKQVDDIKNFLMKKSYATRNQ